MPGAVWNGGHGYDDGIDASEYDLSSELYFKVQNFHCSQGVRGIGCIVGPTLVGYLFDWTGTYAIANTAGCITLMCGVGCMIGVKIIHKHHFRKSAYLK